MATTPVTKADRQTSLERMQEATAVLYPSNANTPGLLRQLAIANIIEVTVGSADVSNTIAHGLVNGSGVGILPSGYLVLNQDAAASLYDAGTTWTTTNIYLKSSVAGVTYTLAILA